MKTILTFTFLMSCFFLLTHCDHQIISELKSIEPSSDESTSNESSSENAPIFESMIINECPYIGSRNCKGQRSCEQICQSLYSEEKHREQCINLSLELVWEFQSIVAKVSESRTNFDSKILGCLIDIHEEPLIKTLESLPLEDSHQFLNLIAEDRQLARILKKEDRHGDILKTLFTGVGYNSLLEMLQEPRMDHNFLYQINLQGNRNAFKYLDRYLEQDFVSPSIRRYCQGFIGWGNPLLTNFSKEPGIFSEEYSAYVEGENYSYDLDPESVGGFLDYCKVQASTISLKKSCPDIGETLHKEYLLGKFQINDEGVYTSSFWNPENSEEVLVINSSSENLESEIVEEIVSENETLEKEIEGSTITINVSLGEKENSEEALVLNSSSEDLESDIVENQTSRESVVVGSFSESEPLVARIEQEDENLFIWLNIKDTHQAPNFLYIGKNNKVQRFDLTPMGEEGEFQKYTAQVEKSLFKNQDRVQIYLAQSSQEDECTFLTSSEF